MRVWKKVLIGLGLGLVVAAVAVTPLFGTKVRPEPEVVAGYRVAEVAMPHRGGAVEALHIWYPATEGAVSLIGQNALFYGFYGRQDAVPAAATAPVVVMSHGSGGNGRALGWLGSALAAQGMIVIIPNHLGTMSADSDPHQTPMIWQRTQDLSVALDYLEERPFGLQPDMERVAAMGFSLGGGAAMVFSGARLSKAAFVEGCKVAGKPDCDWMKAAGVDFDAIDAAKYEADWKDPRVTATLVIDPALAGAMTDESLAAMSHPVQLINLGAPEELGAMRVDDLAPRLPDARYYSVAGARHFAILAECSWMGWAIVGLSGDDNICSDEGLRPRAELHAELLEQVFGFLGQDLR